MGIENEQVDNISTDLAEAWDASEAERLGDEPAETLKLEEGEGDGTQAVQPAEQGSQASGEPDGGSENRQPDPDNSEGIQPSRGAEAKQQAAADAGERAPVGLPPEAREAWKDAPQALKDAIVKREADYSAGIQQYAEGAKRAQTMDAALQPFQQFFATNGGTPAQTISGVLQTASMLQMGAPQQKAEAIAGLIKQFGVDIGALDSLLVGEKPQSGQNDALAQMLDQRLGPINQFMHGYQQNQQNQFSAVQQEMSTEIDTFAAANEFYNDLKMDMADLMDMAGNRGKNMSMKQAYDKAVLMHPQISTIVSGRLGQKQVDKKRVAASSISGNLGGPGGGAAEGSLTQMLNDAWDQQGRT